MGQLGAVLSLAVFLASCAAIRPEHCPYADWSATGELHASKGFQSRLPSLYETCVDVGVVPDGNAYIAGYQRGLLGFCTIENGWVWGGNRTINPGICPPALSPGYDRAFKTHASLERMAVDEASLIAQRDALEVQLFETGIQDIKLLRELRTVRKGLDRIELERHRTRSGFANWLRQMGLEAPLDLYSY